MFAWGVEKGRIAYFVTLGLFVACITVLGTFALSNRQMEMPGGGILPLIALAGVGVYALSWYLSIVFYRSRDAKS